MTDSELAQATKARAQELGFDLVGITGAEPSVFAAEYRAWLGRGFAGEMGYLERNVERRLDPRGLLPDARSIIVVGMNYYTDEEDCSRRARGDAKEEAGHTPRNEETDAETGPSSPRRSGADRQADTGGGTAAVSADRAVGPAGDDVFQEPQSPPANRAQFARYARGDDYHDILTPRLRTLLEFLKSQAGDGAEGRVYVDTGPIMEREVARRAGLGWFGKNTMLINTRRGSYFLLGEIVTNVALPPDAPAVGGCGSCTRCIDACPTGAIVAPYELDARRCISYLTIELKGPIPDEFHPAIAQTGRIFGCDICQEVCPFNRPAASSAHPTLSPTSEPSFQPRLATIGRDLAELALLTEEEFREQFRRSPVKRAKWRGLMRNVAAGLAASDDPIAEASLTRSGSL
ncbi:MAG TPA: tRNA epoxyqueuosine(34) reductase QueG [Chthonomonadaceae bacterium]|nr:tRNA epoxyqueuosine(34) reductase QueG [Chthonomonadaceae bacterium]